MQLHGEAGALLLLVLLVLHGSCRAGVGSFRGSCWPGLRPLLGSCTQHQQHQNIVWHALCLQWESSGLLH